MKRGGFEINQNVEVAVDEGLPFMGYTSRQWQRQLIVVSGFAVESSMLEGLLTHELSHVYRNQTKHPSHNDQIIAGLVSSFISRHDVNEDYQREILHQAVNHVQDLYADDVAIKILTAEKSDSADLERLGDFFSAWVRDEPIKTGIIRKDEWMNASIMLSNCFAISNMQRHAIPDRGDRAKMKNEAFMRASNPVAADSFSYFNTFMVNLKEGISDAEYQRRMEEYLSRFLALVDVM
jgi:hypothetical protein